MRKKQQTTEHEDSNDHITPRTSSASASGEKHKARRYILERINRPILEIYFHLNNNLRKRKKNCATSSLLKKKILGYFFYPNAGLSLLGHFFSVTQPLGQMLQPNVWVVF